jgi:mono/diheme cytochrome c family protein
MNQPRRRRRRTWQTGIALALAGLIVASLAVGGASRSFPLTSIDFARGQAIFVQRCASCHAVDPHARAALGPHLGKIGQEAANRVAGQTAEQYLLTSIVDPAAFRATGGNGIMPADVSAGLSAVDVASLIGYLMQQGAQPNPRRLVDMLPNIATRKRAANCFWARRGASPAIPSRPSLDTVCGPPVCSRPDFTIGPIWNARFAIRTMS